LKAFQVNLKACLGLVIPNQYCPIVIWENWGWFLSDFILWAMPTSWLSLLWTTIVVHNSSPNFMIPDCHTIRWGNTYVLRCTKLITRVSQWKVLEYCTTVLYPSMHFLYGMVFKHSRDTTILIVLLLCTTPDLPGLWIYHGPYRIWKFQQQKIVYVISQNIMATHPYNVVYILLFLYGMRNGLLL